jgi:acetolactate synthase I/II/III large subunit
MSTAIRNVESNVATVKISDYIMETLVQHGIRQAFMISGGGAMHLVDSVGRHPQLDYVCCHHEQACAIAAEGYARASGQMAAVIVTSGPGGTNTLTGVAGQWLDSIPAIYISGQVKQETTITSCPGLKLRQLGDQELNVVDLVRPMTKYAVMVRDPREMGYHLHRALYLATHGRPGPVWLDIPLDIQAASVALSDLLAYEPSEDEILFDAQILREQAAELLARIRQASRPVIIAGHGIRLAGAVEEFHELIVRLNVPVLTAICGHDLIWSDHPLFAGRPGICGDRHGNMALQNSDLMLAIGARLGVRQISYDYNNLAKEAFRAMVDIDPAELEKPTLRLHMPVHADAKCFIKEMLRQLGDKIVSPKKSWINWCRDRKQTLPTVFDDNSHRPGYVNSYTFADALFRQLPPDALVVTANGTAYTSTYQVMQIKKGTRVFANQACASMGYDLPAAIGACIARGGPVVLLAGDGSIQMNIQELQTIVNYRLPIKIFVYDNRGYLSIRLTQDAYFEGRHIASGPELGVTCPDVCRIAEAYGLPTARLEDETDLDSNLSRLLDLPGPLVCNLHMDPNQTVLPKLSSSVGPDGRLISRPLEDMYPFLPRNEFYSHMLIQSCEKKCA